MHIIYLFCMFRLKIYLYNFVLYILIIYKHVQTMKNNQGQINLITQQKNLLKKIYGQGENLWKVLIFDNFNREINSSLFKMKDLRENNITLYFNIKETREQLHGVTAIYLVQPTSENIQIIIQDFEEDLYSSVIIHFSNEPQPHILSSFAKTLGKKKNNCITKISKVQYSTLGFHTISKNIAIAQNNNQLINLILTLKNRPIFVYGQKEEQQVQFIIKRLEQSAAFNRQQETIKNRQADNIVLLFNRQLDYFPVLSHTINYAGLIQSIYKISQNGHRIVKSKESFIQIDLNDEIWVQRRNLPTSQMHLQEQFNKIKVQLMGQKDKIDQLNDLPEKSKKIQLHIHTAEQLIKQAISRKLNQFNECQLQIYRKRVLTSQLKKDINILFQTCKNDTDKVRLILIILIYCEHIDSKEIQQFQEKVPQLKKSRLFNELKNKLTKQKSQNSKGMIGGSSKMLKKFTLGFINNFKSGDKFLVTKYIEKIRDLKESDLKQLDLNMRSIGNISSDVKINNIIVHCVGGACLSEQANISKFDNKVIYTGDKMINANDLI